MRETTARYSARIRDLWARRNSGALYFVPGAFLVLLSLAMVAMPSVFIFLMAGLFLFSGMACCYAAWRFLLIKKRVEAIFKDLSGRIVIHGLEIQQDAYDAEQAGAEGKKIVYH